MYSLVASCLNLPLARSHELTGCLVRRTPYHGHVLVHALAYFLSPRPIFVFSLYYYLHRLAQLPHVPTNLKLPTASFRYNPINCNPVERHEGGNKRMELCLSAEGGSDGIRTKAIDFEVIMQTVMEHSKGEKLFFKVLAGNGIFSPSLPY